MLRALIVLLLLFAVPAAAQVRPYDPGGRVETYLDAVLSGQPQEVRGTCLSACVLRLAAPRVCVSPDAAIGAHEVRDAPGGNYVAGTRNSVVTKFFWALLPYCVRATFPPHSFDKGELTYISGQDILNTCPAIHVCS